MDIHAAPSDTTALIPAVLHLAEQISMFPAVQTIILYGSRARGTHTAFSDIDIAVTGVEDEREWSRIRQLTSVESDTARTLLKIDLVRFELAEPQLQKSIRQEGRILYERR